MTANDNRPPNYGFVDGQLVIYAKGDIVAIFPESYIPQLALELCYQLQARK